MGSTLTTAGRRHPSNRWSGCIALTHVVPPIAVKSNSQARYAGPIPATRSSARVDDCPSARDRDEVAGRSVMPGSDALS